MRHVRNPSIKNRIYEWLELCDLSLELLKAGDELSVHKHKGASFLQQNFREKQPIRQDVLRRMII